MSYRLVFDHWKREATLRITRAVLTRRIPSATKRLIVFLTPGYQFKSGGIMAIGAMYQESRRMAEIHRARVVLCTTPGEPPQLKYTWFENRNYILDLEAVLERCGHLDFLQLHIPEYTLNPVLDWLEKSSRLLRNVSEVHLNVLVFNVDLMKGQRIGDLARFGKATCTTAHEAYSNLETRAALGVALHKLLICKGAEFYSPAGYQDKEALMVVSHDDHPIKEQLLQKITQAFPDLTIQIIRDIAYEDYAKLIRRAKWSLTFGEGLDGYFAEPTFSGAVAFAVFNERFFTPPFAKLETVYASWDVLNEKIVGDMRRLDDPLEYNRAWRQAYDLVSETLDTERFRENLRAFYRGEYTFP